MDFYRLLWPLRPWVLLNVYNFKVKYIIRDFYPLVFFYALGLSLGGFSFLLFLRVFYVWFASGYIPTINAFAAFSSFIASAQGEGRDVHNAVVGQGVVLGICQGGQAVGVVFVVPVSIGGFQDQHVAGVGRVGKWQSILLTLLLFGYGRSESLLQNACVPIVQPIPWRKAPFLRASGGYSNPWF